MYGDGLLLPRRDNGSNLVRWAKPAYRTVHHFLTNPVYAGAFAFGRTRVEKRLDEAGRLVLRTRHVPRAEWGVLIPHHPGFVSWERYVRNQEVLRANWHPPRGEGGRAVREGASLLQGLVRCGRCGPRCKWRTRARVTTSPVTCAGQPGRLTSPAPPARAWAAVALTPGC
jgi:hypothetical protein